MEFPSDFPEVDTLIASAVNYLLQGDERETSLLLLQCKVRCIVTVYDEPSPSHRGEVQLELAGPRKPYEAFSGYSGDSAIDELWNAISAVLPSGFVLVSIRAKAEMLDTVKSDWRDEMQTRATGQEVSNQGVEIPNREIITWRNMRFRSQHEVRIAAALDATGVLFLPNCLARLGPKETQNAQGSNTPRRFTKEADFLICANGKWGVLEVDGSQHEGAAAQDHERDRLFQYHGIRVTQRFTAKECYNDAPNVVRRFLTLLAQNG